ncbi:MAG: inositol monophosphatase family protein [Actinomycetota bacterium]|nr:inositol monophosphatase family protein [Actinomycetota bacterium]
MDDVELIDLLERTADAVGAVLTAHEDFDLVAGSDQQHHSDLVADEAALAVLEPSGVRILSEESAITDGGANAAITVVVDPLDGSTNAKHRLPWYGVSLCAVDADGPRASLVRRLAGPDGPTWRAVRGGGATRDGAPIRSGTCRTMDDAILASAGPLPDGLRWRQFRVLGAAALDLCCVADGNLDGWVDGSDGHRPWDYLGALLVCTEAGAFVDELDGLDLVVLDHDVRRRPVAAATDVLGVAMRDGIRRSTRSH